MSKPAKCRYIQNVMIMVLSLTVISACSDKSASEPEKNIIVQIDNRTLSADKIRSMIHPAASEIDSAAITNTYVDNWIRDQLMMRVAADRYVSDPNIESLVQEYRENLLKFKLEEAILADRYDSTITQNELFAYYSENKRQFVLNKPIYRVLLIKLSSDSPDIDALNKLWKQKDYNQVFTITENLTNVFLMDTTQWLSSDQLLVFGEGLIPSFVEKMPSLYEKEGGGIKLFLKIYDKLDKGESAPLTYVEEEVALMILHNRKTKILRDFKEELYNSALRNNEIRLFN